LPAGWGIDALLSIYGRGDKLEPWLQTLTAARLTYLRERAPGLANPESARTGPISVYRRLRAAGYRVLAFAETPGLKPTQSWDQFPEDLMAVYWATFDLARRLQGDVSVWELPNEPDTLYSRDLPDRIAAFCKAEYLGLRDGAAAAQAEMEDGRWKMEDWGKDGSLKMEDGKSVSPSNLPSAICRLLTPISHLLALKGAHQPASGVLMSALGNFPGPWLERAAENGLFDYTDGLNVHFYGQARDFAGALRAQRAFAGRWVKDRTLPVWVTECGINAVPMDEIAESRGREIQREFVLETATAAWREGVAVFLPFVLTWPKEEWFALLHGPRQPYPAWAAYAEFTRTHALPVQPALAPPANPARVVLQWLPDNETCIPHKVSGSYWFRGDPRAPDPMAARLILYNFSSAAVTGRWRMDAPPEVAVTDGADAPLVGGTVTIPAWGRVAVPMGIRSVAGTVGAAAAHARSTLRFRFEATGCPDAVAVTWVETRPSRENLPRRWALTGTRPGGTDFQWAWAPEPFAVTDAAGPWLGVNGVRVVGTRERTPPGDVSRATRFRIAGQTVDPRLPPMAITKVAGLPGGPDAFLHLRFPNDAHTEGGVRVDLVDAQGQRFSVAENLGRNRFRNDPANVWLAYRDFHIYAWGRCSENPVFRPEAIREIQLRFYPVVKDARIPIALEIASP
jgi:hypothetical protein